MDTIRKTLWYLKLCAHICNKYAPGKKEAQSFCCTQLYYKKENIVNGLQNMPIYPDSLVK